MLYFYFILLFKASIDFFGKKEISFFCFHVTNPNCLRNSGDFAFELYLRRVTLKERDDGQECELNDDILSNYVFANYVVSACW